MEFKYVPGWENKLDQPGGGGWPEGRSRGNKQPRYSTSQISRGADKSECKGRSSVESTHTPTPSWNVDPWTMGLPQLPVTNCVWVCAVGKTLEADLG